MEMTLKEVLEITLALVVIIGIGFFAYKAISGQLIGFFKGLGGGLFLSLK
jgi:uncharacterized protein YxeA